MPLCVRKVVPARGVEAKEHSEVVGEFGEPYRGRTYGELIKRPAETLRQDAQEGESSTKKGGPIRDDVAHHGA